MAYSSSDDKFSAVVSCDQDASSAFVFVYKDSNTYCRPTCQTHPSLSGKSDLSYFPSPEAAKAAGCKPCVTCNPDLPVQIDTSIIQQTVDSVNASLQIEIPDKSSPPASGNMLSPQSPPKPYRHNRSSSLATNREFDEDDWRPRRASIANGHIAAAAAAVKEISKSSSSRRDEKHRGEGDHARLVNEACMHIAAAAAAAAAQAVSSKDEGAPKKGRSQSRSSSSVDRTKQMFKTQRKKRRGGILGFKELAAKAGLSPWHFHRVFRSVTGLTPKAYGDACWNTVTSSISTSTLLAQKQVPVPGPSPESSPEAVTSVQNSPVGTIVEEDPTSLDITNVVSEQLPFVGSSFNNDSVFDSASSLYTSQSMDSVVSSSSEDTQVADSWTIPATYMDSNMPSVTMAGYDLMEDWNEKPMGLNDLMSNDFKMEPNLPLMNLDDVTPATTGFYDLPTTTTSTQTPVEESLRPKSRLQKVKSGLGEPLFDSPMGGSFSFSAAMSYPGNQTPTEPWLASPQPLQLEGSETVPPLFS